MKTIILEYPILLDIETQICHLQFFKIGVSAWNEIKKKQLDSQFDQKIKISNLINTTK